MQDRIGAFQQVVLLALIFFSSLFLIPHRIFEGDHLAIIRWAQEFVTQGIPNAYKVELYNYGAATVYILYGFGMLVGSQMAKFHLLVRQFFFLFDLGAIFVLMRYLEHNRLNAVRALFVLFNLAFLYNSLLWGQLDGVFTAFVFASVVAGLVGQPELAAAFFVAAFNVKPQPVIYFPLVGLLLIPGLKRQPWRIVTTLASAAGAQLLLLTPFLQNGAWRAWIDAYTANANLFPIASANAHNFWPLVLTGDPMIISDTTTFLGVSYKTWGVLMFGLYGLAALVPVLLRVAVRTQQRTPYTQKDGTLVMLAAGVISVGFFFFNTEMHERYVYPAVLFLGTYAVMARAYFLYILVSVAHLLNINYVFWHIGQAIPTVQRFYTPELVAALFLVAVVVGLAELYHGQTLREDAQEFAAGWRNWRPRRAFGAAV